MVALLNAHHTRAHQRLGAGRCRLGRALAQSHPRRRNARVGTLGVLVTAFRASEFQMPAANPSDVAIMNPHENPTILAQEGLQHLALQRLGDLFRGVLRVLPHVGDARHHPRNPAA